jgi:hypothetical protein
MIKPMRQVQRHRYASNQGTESQRRTEQQISVTQHLVGRERGRLRNVGNAYIRTDH